MGEPFISMVLEFMDVSLSPKNNIVYLWRHQDTTQNSELLQSMCLKISKFQISTTLEMLAKTGTEHHEGPSKNLENLEHGLNIFQKT